MNKSLLSFFLFFLIIGIIPLGFNNTPVKATTFTICNWDDVSSGNSSGTSGYIDFENSSDCPGSSWQTNLGWSRSGYNSFYVYTLGNDIVGSPEGKMGWWNLTQSFDYISRFSFYVNFSATNLVTQVNYLYLYFNDSSYDVLKLRFSCSSDHSTYATLQNYDVSTGWTSVEKLYVTDALNPYKITVTHVQTNLMNVSLYNSTNDLVGGIETSASTSNTWDTFESIYFWCSDNNQGNWVKYYFDDFEISTDTPPEEQSFYVNFFDAETGVYFDYFNFVGPLHYSDPLSYLSGALSSDINYDIPYAISTDPFPVELTGSFSSGSWHWINLSGIYTWIQGESKAFYNFSTCIQIYEGQTYSFGITPVDWSENYVNMECGEHYSWFHNWPIGHTLKYCLATDKRYYSSGETVNIRYKMPTIGELADHGLDTSGWELWVYDSDNITDLYITTTFDNGDSADLVHTNLVYDKSWHEVNFDPKTPAGGADKYFVLIAKDGWPSGYELIYGFYLTFYVTSDAFSPSGNITAISPSSAYIGQFINITWNANNNGHLTYQNVYDSESSEFKFTGFTKFTGTKSTEFAIWNLGQYKVNLYVSDGEIEHLVDTDYFWVNDTSGTPGGFGYGIEFLTVDPYWAIAGYDTVKVNYKTLINDTKIIVIDARGQSTPYGTLADAGVGKLEFKLPPNAPIGNWTVTMYGNETHNSSFYVIADENNYFQFTKNIFYEGEPFSIAIVHDKKVALTFYRNGVAMGQDVVFDVQQQTVGIYRVPLSIVEPTVGEWTCEMYEVNKIVRRNMLARDTCMVKSPIRSDPTEGSYDSILGMIAMGADFFGGGSFGLMVISIIIVGAAIGAAAYLKLDGSSTTLIGMITCLGLVYIGWMPWWIGIVSIVFTGLMFGEALSKKLNLGGK